VTGACGIVQSGSGGVPPNDIALVATGDGQSIEVEDAMAIALFSGGSASICTTGIQSCASQPTLVVVEITTRAKRAQPQDRLGARRGPARTGAAHPGLRRGGGKRLLQDAMPSAVLTRSASANVLCGPHVGAGICQMLRSLRVRPHMRRVDGRATHARETTCRPVDDGSARDLRARRIQCACHVPSPPAYSPDARAHSEQEDYHFYDYFGMMTK
jgi:hypothetical protein